MTSARELTHEVAADLWSVAYRAHAHVPRGGRIPTTPPAAMKAAGDLVGLYETVNGKPIAKAYREWVAVMESTVDDPGFVTPHYFASLVVRQAMGMSRQAPFESVYPKIPQFEVTFDGDSLVWTGGGEPTENPGRATGWRSKGRDSFEKKIGEHWYTVEKRGGGMGWSVGRSKRQGDDDIDVMGGAPTKQRAMARAETYEFDPFYRREHHNPVGILTEKGERMYEDIKASYGTDPRASELAMRTVYARAREGVPGLLRVGTGKPPWISNGRR